MDIMDLAVKKREAAGTRAARGLRRQGGVPAILYGHGIKPMSLEVNLRMLQQVLHTKAGENVVINLKVEGAKLKESTCRVREIQHNPVSDDIAHVDFTIISLTERIEVKVPVTVLHMEEAAGVKEGGVFDLVQHEIDVECLPTEIPEKIEVDVKNMKIGDAIYVKDLNIPKGVTPKLGPEEVVATLHPPAKEEAAPTEEQPTQPEVIEKGKKEEAAEGEEAAPKAAQAEAPKAEKKAK
ncbi:MAG: 50S ribosomal protein L25/general stress protein Ctc [Candidatus Omnitrophica bacterium]|nr:50S ribosomal protein L25/general stress protein Ctc [Candidatus Omnitrophota bacterium]